MAVTSEQALWFQDAFSKLVEITGLVLKNVGEATGRVAGGKPISWSTAQFTTGTSPP